MARAVAWASRHCLDWDATVFAPKVRASQAMSSRAQEPGAPDHTIRAPADSGVWDRRAYSARYWRRMSQTAPPRGSNRQGQRWRRWRLPPENFGLCNRCWGCRVVGTLRWGLCSDQGRGCRFAKDSGGSLFLRGLDLSGPWVLFVVGKLSWVRGFGLVDVGLYLCLLN